MLCDGIATQQKQGIVQAAAKGVLYESKNRITKSYFEIRNNRNCTASHKANVFAL